MPQPTPPAPLASPAPNWLILTYAQADSAGFRVVTITSDVVLHLSLEYTPQEPLQSYRRRWRRGMGWIRDKHWSYFPVGLIAQDEAGETLTHTFRIPSHYCTTRLWLRFAHDYAAQYVCPVCGQTTLPQFNWLVINQEVKTLTTMFYCSVCDTGYTLGEIKNATTSKSTTPFFPVLPATSPENLIYFESFYPWPYNSLLYFEEFSS